VPLIMLGAPLGNPGDASARLREALETADVVAAEDTRRLARLAADLGITVSARTVSYFEGNEERRTPELIEALKSGDTVAVITDGGMPSVSDPGFRLVRAALAEGIALTSVPGPTAVTTALTLSGLPCDRFCFEGFPPRKPGERRAAFDDLADEPRTLVFFEAPHRVAGTLADLAAAFGADRPAALARELTKTHEEVRRGTLGELVASVGADPPRGEITLVVGGAPARAAVVVGAAGNLVAAVAALEATGTTRKAAISAVAKAHNLPKRDVYAAVVATRGQ
jgi:16S rRNA (cytidine1402-2'-O)-methyltransferase